MSNQNFALGFYLSKPKELNKPEFNKIHELILKGEEVAAKTLTRRLNNAELVAYATANNEIASVAVMKNPDLRYKDGLFNKAGANENPSSFPFELGYVFTSKKYRGNNLASALCDNLCEVFSTQNIYATVRLGNSPMQKILSRNGFIQEGKAYQGRKEQLLLFVRKSSKKEEV